jgi:hypothetical protein
LTSASVVKTKDFIFHRVESVSRSEFSGFVYNFETVTGWFGCHDLIIHNCRCVANPITGEEQDALQPEDLNE